MILFLNNNADIAAIEKLPDRLRFMGFESTIEIEGNHKALAIIHGVDQYTCEKLFTASRSVTTDIIKNVSAKIQI